jgi:hypothetical protein
MTRMKTLLYAGPPATALVHEPLNFGIHETMDSLVHEFMNKAVRA